MRTQSTLFFTLAALTSTGFASPLTAEIKRAIVPLVEIAERAQIDGEISAIPTANAANHAVETATERQTTSAEGIGAIVSANATRHEKPADVAPGAEEIHAILAANAANHKTQGVSLARAEIDATNHAGEPAEKRQETTVSQAEIDPITTDSIANHAGEAAEKRQERLC
ncbi:hypothetical protein BJ875DRAFT_488834 [Amylocarpus encephaloides]|uniref:SMP domain-containing protein n=1 Tax=Amylocarpus encephaloides TaxID=45428 RepID=A0A9P7Y9A9_9HELO|nr:hypothetical protein BJ875DRAFT_488834 [Amylocarpus encephaloides]